VLAQSIEGAADDERQRRTWQPGGVEAGARRANEPRKGMTAGRIFRDFLLIVATAASSVLCWADENTDQAIKAAASWLALVDAKEYDKSWAEAAPLFQEKISEKDWVRMVAFVREPLGEVKSRQLLGAQPATTLPGAPEGEYVVIFCLSGCFSKPLAIV
jgi:hypothetical protein